MGATLVVRRGPVFLVPAVTKTEYISQREGMAIVALGWTRGRPVRCPAVLF